jgi:hypothetical protein
MSSPKLALRQERQYRRSDQPLVSPPEANDPAYTDCSAPQGFTENHFSSTVELFGG